MLKKPNCVRYRQLHCIHKADDIYKDIAANVETRFDTSDYELDRLQPKIKNKKVIGLMKDELGGKIMTKFFRIRATTFTEEKKLLNR